MSTKTQRKKLLKYFADAISYGASAAEANCDSGDSDEFRKWRDTAWKLHAQEQQALEVAEDDDSTAEDVARLKEEVKQLKYTLKESERMSKYYEKGRDRYYSVAHRAMEKLDEIRDALKGVFDLKKLDEQIKELDAIKNRSDS